MSAQDAFPCEEGGVAMAILTHDDLARIGVDIAPEIFERMVASTVREMPPVAPTGDPQHDLTIAEVEALERGGFDVAPDTDEHVADDPLARGAAEYAVLLATALSPAQAAERLGIDASRVRHRLAARTLYGVRKSDGWRLPLFQFDPASGKELPGIGAVLAGIDPDLHPVSVQRWFVSPDPDLEIDGVAVSPRDWLRHGGSPRTIAPLVNIV